jgi:hypothetical protein
MQLVEVMVAAAVFTAASGSSLQLWSHAAVSSQAAELRQQQLERIELDRLQLQAHWRHDLASDTGCGISRDQLVAVASALPVPPQLQRELLPGDQVDALRVRWRVASDPALLRERLFTPAGLGLCQSDAPLTDSQVEEALP